MSSAPREDNRVPSLVAKSDADNTPVIVEADPVTKRLKVSAVITSGGGGGSGTQYADGDARGTATGTLSMVDDGTLIQSMAGDSSGNAKVVGTGTAGSAAGGVLTVQGAASMTPVAVNMTQLNGSAAVAIATGVQATGISDGTNNANILKSDGTAAGQNSLMVAPTAMAVGSLSAGSLNADLVASTDVSNYRYGSLTVTGTWSGTLTIQGSNDNSNFFTINSSGTSGSTTVWTTGTITGNTTQQFPVFFKYLRIRMTSYTSGTANGTLNLLTLPPISSTGATVLNGGPVGTVGSAVPTSAINVGVSDGTNSRSLLGAATGLNSTGSGIPTAQIVAQFDDVAPTSITENQFGNVRMSTNRNLYGTIRDAAGNERGANVNASSQLSVSVDNSPVLGAGSAVIGKVSIDQTTPGTTNLVALAANQTVNLAQVGGTNTVNGGVAGSQSIGGTVATNVAITANPVNLGAQAVSSENSAVTTARQVQLVADLVGKLIVLPYANPENFVSGTATATDTTSTSLVASPGGSLRNYITQFTVWNSSATNTYIKIQDGSGGTTLYTLPCPTVGGSVITLPTPLRQPTTATAIFFAANASANAVFISASGYKGL